MITTVDNRAIAISGSLFKTAKVRDEPYECLDEPQAFICRLKREPLKADLFTFLQEMYETIPKYQLHQEWHSLAIAPLTTYENWWKKQINDKTRNMIRRAQKTGVEFSVIEFNHDFVRGVMDIYNESPLRQGVPFKHYQKDFHTIKRELATFSGRSEFVGAFFKGELIGFIKFVSGKNVASLMHIISKLAHRDKAPTNGLIAKAVEMCSEREIPLLHYGLWSSRGLGDFKRHHGFVCRNVPRYFVPLNGKGKLMLKLNLHRTLVEFIPQEWIDELVSWRTRWNSLRYARR